MLNIKQKKKMEKYKERRDSRYIEDLKIQDKIDDLDKKRKELVKQQNILYKQSCNDIREEYKFLYRLKTIPNDIHKRHRHIPYYVGIYTSKEQVLKYIDHEQKSDDVYWTNEIEIKESIDVHDNDLKTLNSYPDYS